MKEYWPIEHRKTKYGLATLGFCELEFRAEIAMRLISHFGAIAGKRPPGAPPGPDAGVELQTPEELVERCFAIADLFIAKCEERGAIRPISEEEQP